MTSLLNANLPSEDEDEEEDDDYNPALDTTGEPEDRLGHSAKPSLKRRRAATLSASRAIEPSTSQPEVAAEEDPSNPRMLAKKAKVDALWQQLNKGAAKAGAAAAPPRAGMHLGSLCRTVEQKAGPDPNETWMRSLGFKSKSTKPADATSPTSQARQTIHAAADRNVDNTSAGLGSTALPVSAKYGSGSITASASMRAMAAAALAAAKEAASVASGRNHGKMAVTETRRFAGKDIKVTVAVDKDSKEAQEAVARAAAPPSTSGLDAVLAEMEKKKKVNVLDKSKMDWQEFKSTNMEVEEELESYKKSGDQFLDRKQFLQRAEMREYEQERDTRLAGDIRTRGRL